MKKFLVKNVIFLIPIFLFLIIELILPLNTFTFRPWEALLFNDKQTIGSFYPNQNIEMISEGDLCYNTKLAVKKNENWITDKLGFRNNQFLNNPKILIIGDSFVAGSSLPQDSTLSNLLNNRLNTDVYNMAPATFSDFLELINKKIINKPNLLIFSIVERNIPPVINYDLRGNVYSPIGKLSIILDRISRLYSINYFKARVNKDHGDGVPGLVDPRMCFYENHPQYEKNQLEYTVDNIKTYKHICDSLGINFLFLPIPNKETVYYDLIPLEKQPDYLLKLDSVLRQDGVNTINTLQIVNEYRKNNSKFIYQFDDSHWNSEGVELIANQLIFKLKNN